MNIPLKIKKGDQFNSKIIDTINGIIDYLTSTKIIQGAGIQLQQYATGTLVSSTARSGQAAAMVDIPYYGDFTIIDLSQSESAEEAPNTSMSVAVAHGWTWNPTGKHSRYSAVYINGRLFCCSCRIFENLSKSGVYYIYVHDRPDTLDGPEVICSVSQMTSQNIDFYYEIGQIVDGHVIQTHKSGPLVLYDRCFDHLYLT